MDEEKNSNLTVSTGILTIADGLTYEFDDYQFSSGSENTAITCINGSLIVSDSVISGNDVGILIEDGEIAEGEERPDVNVELHNVTLSDNNTAVVLSGKGDLLLDNVTSLETTGQIICGDSDADGTFTISNSTFSGKGKIEDAGDTEYNAIIDVYTTKANVSLTLKDSSFTDFYSNGVGGVLNWGEGEYDHLLYCNTHEITVDGCYFADNYVESYGVLFTDYMLGSFIVSNSQFINNYSPGQNAALIYASGTQTKIINSVFSGNSIGNSEYSNNKGIVMLIAGNSLEISNTIFSDNYSGYLGHGISIESYRTALIENCVFSGNEFYSLSSALINSDADSMTIRNTEFSNNKDCTILYSWSNDNSFFIENCTFSDNDARALQWRCNKDWAVLSVSNSSFCGNKINVIDIDVGGSEISATISDCYIANNLSSGEGAVCVSGDGISHIKNTVFFNNIAVNAGEFYRGAIVAEYTNLYLTDCVFATASDTIFLGTRYDYERDTNLYLFGTNYFSSKISLLNATDDCNHVYYQDGAVIGLLPTYTDRNAEYLFDVSVINNADSNMRYAVDAQNMESDQTYYLAKNMVGSTVYMKVHSAELGEMAYYSGSSKTFYYDTWRYDLSAADSTMTIRRTDSGVNNYVVVGSDEVRYFDSDDVFQNITIPTGYYYAAITNNGTVYVDGSQFLSNDLDGVRNYGTAEIKNAIFKDNVNHSAIRNAAGTLTVDNSQFINNTSSNCGAAIHADSGTVVISNSTFSGNSSSYGGAIYSLDAAITLENNYFTTVTDDITLNNSGMTLKGFNYFAGTIHAGDGQVKIGPDATFGFYLNNYGALTDAYIDGKIFDTTTDDPETQPFTCSVSLEHYQRGTFVFAENFNQEYLGFDITQIKLVINGGDSPGEYVLTEGSNDIYEATYTFTNTDGLLSIVVTDRPVYQVLVNSEYTEEYVPEKYQYGYNAFSDVASALDRAQEYLVPLKFTGGSFSDAAIRLDGVETFIEGGTFRNDVYADGGTLTVTDGILMGSVYGGGASESSIENTSVTVSGGSVSNLYGGSNAGNISGNTDLVISGGTVTNVHGAGYGDNISGNVNITVSGGEIAFLYAGGYESSVAGTITVNVSGGTITGGAYGQNRDLETVLDAETILNISGAYSFAADAVIEKFDRINFTIDDLFSNDISYYVLSAGNFNLSDTVVTINNVRGSENNMFMFSKDGEEYAYRLVNTGSELALTAAEHGVILCQNGEAVASTNKISSVSLSGTGEYRTMFVLVGGEAEEVTVNDDGHLFVGIDGGVSGVTADSNSTVTLNLGSINHMTMLAGSVLNASSGGELLDLTIYDKAAANISTAALTGFSGNTSKGYFQLSENILNNYFVTRNSTFTVNSSGFAFGETLAVAGTFLLSESAAFNDTVITLDLAPGNEKSMLSGWENAVGTYSIVLGLGLEDAALPGVYLLADDVLDGAELLINNISVGSFANGEKKIISDLDNNGLQLNYRFYTDENSGQTGLYIYDLAVAVEFPEIWENAPTELQTLDHSAVLSDEKVYFEIENGVGAYIKGQSIMSVYGAGENNQTQDVYIYVDCDVNKIVGGGKAADTEGDIYIYAAPNVSLGTVILGGETGTNSGDAHLYLRNSSANSIERGNLSGTASVTIDNKKFTGIIKNIDDLELLNNSSWKIASDSILNNGMNISISLDNRTLSSDAIISASSSYALNGTLDIVPNEMPAEGTWFLTDNVDLSDLQITVNGNSFTDNTLFYNGYLYTLHVQEDPSAVSDSYLEVESKWITPVFPENWENMPERLSDISYARKQYLGADDISYSLTNGIGGALLNITLTQDLFAGFSSTSAYTGDTWLYFDNVNTDTVFAGEDNLEGTEDDITVWADIYGSGKETRTGDIYIAIDGGSYGNIYASGSGGVTGNAAVSITGYATVSGKISGAGISGDRLLRLENSFGSYLLENFNQIEIVNDKALLYTSSAETYALNITVDDLSDFTAAPALTVGSGSSMTVNDLALNLDFDTSARGDWRITSGVNLSDDATITVNGADYTLGDTLVNIPSMNKLVIDKDENGDLVLTSSKHDAAYIVYSDDDNYITLHDRFMVDENFYYAVITEEDSDISLSTFSLGVTYKTDKKVQLDIESYSKVSYTTFNINNCAEVTINAKNVVIKEIYGYSEGTINLKNTTILRRLDTRAADVNISGSSSVILDGIVASDVTISGGQIIGGKEGITINSFTQEGGEIYGDITVSGDATLKGGSISGTVSAKNLTLYGGEVIGSVAVDDLLTIKKDSTFNWQKLSKVQADVLEAYAGFSLFGDWNVNEAYSYESFTLNVNGGSSFSADDFHIESGTLTMNFDNATNFNIDKIWIEEYAAWTLSLNNASNITINEIERKVDLLGGDGEINISVSGRSQLTFDDWSISSNDMDFNQLKIDESSKVTFERKVKLDLSGNNKAIKNEGTLIFNGNVDISCINDDNDKEAELAEKGAETIFNGDSEINGDIKVAGTITINNSARIGDLMNITNMANIWGTTTVNTTKDSKIIVNEKGDLILGTDTSMFGDATDWYPLDRCNDLIQKGEMYIYDGGKVTTRGEWTLDNTLGDEAKVYNYGKVLLTTFSSIKLSQFISPSVNFSMKALCSSLVIDKQCEFYNYGKLELESHWEAGIFDALLGAEYFSYDLSEIIVKGSMYNDANAKMDLFGHFEVQGEFYNYGTVTCEEDKDSVFFINDGAVYNYGTIVLPCGRMAENQTLAIDDHAGLRLNDAVLVNYGTIEFGDEKALLFRSQANVSVTGIDKDCTIENYGTLTLDAAEYVEMQGELYNEGVMTIGSSSHFVDFDAQKLYITNKNKLKMYVTADSEIDSKSTIYNTGDLRIEVEETKNFYMSTKDEGDDVVLLNKGSYTHIGNLYFDSDGRNKLKNDVFENRGSFTLKQGKIQLIGDAAEKGDFDYFVSNYDSFTFEDCSAPTLIYGGGLYSYSGTVKFINTKADMTETLAGSGTLELCNSDITLEGSSFSGGANLSEGSHLTYHSLTGYHVVNTGTEGDINVLELSGFSYIQNTGNGALILNAVADNSGSAIVVLTDVAYFSKVTVNVAGDLRTDYAGNFVTLVQQTRSLESEQKFYINFTNESATFSVGEGKYLSCGQYMTLTPEKFNDYTNILNLSVQNYMLSDRSAVRYASAESELFDRFYALDISNLSKTDFVMYVGDQDAAGETITALGYDQYYSQQAAAITGKIIVENSSVGEIAFSDTALEIKGGSTVGKITGKDDNDKITVSDSENYLKQIDLASGINTITVNGAVSELGLEMNSSGKTTVTFTAGSSYENAQISLASSSDVQLKELFLDWNPSSYQEVQILVSSTNDFSNAQYVFVLQNGTEDFTIDLAQNLYYRVDGLTAEGWVSHILNDTVAPDQVWGFHYTETGFVWDAASDNWGGNGVQKYIIEFAADEDFTAILDTVETEQTRYEYTLPEGVTMVYSRVKAVDYDGNAGEWSMISPNIVDETAPVAPGGLTAETDHKNVVFTWDETTDDMTGVKEYTVTYSSANESYSVTLKDTSLALEDLTPGNWTWSVQAVDNAGNISDAAQGEVFVINPFEFAVIGNPLQWVNTDIILTAAAEPGQSLKFAYSFDNTEWIESSVAVISENTTVYFRGENALGETVTYSITVDRIDKT
ncbi:MAG: hypothetical protein J6W67_08020, partial [Lentisphaeria bacterium]|nr:hypothetical protein [Lentisphaeria bacterium]